MRCVVCKEKLVGLPIYNNGDENFPESVLFCNNQECSRFGLLTTVYVVEANDTEKPAKLKEKDGKGKKGKRKSV